MLLPWLRQINPFLLQLLAIVELALPMYLLLGLFLARGFISERLNWKHFPTMVPLILTIIPVIAALHEYWLGFGVVFAVVYLISFVLFGMRAHILFEDCMLPFAFSRHSRYYKPLCALQIFWWLQAPAAAFNGLNWPRGLLWTQTIIAALTLAIMLWDLITTPK